MFWKMTAIALPCVVPESVTLSTGGGGGDRGSRTLRLKYCVVYVYRIPYIPVCKNAEVGAKFCLIAVTEEDRVVIL